MFKKIAVSLICVLSLCTLVACNNFDNFVNVYGQSDVNGAPIDLH